MVKTGNLFLIAMLIFSLITLAGCTESNVQSPPFSVGQFVSRATDLNYANWKNSDYNNRVLVVKNDKISVADANDLNVALPDLSDYVDWIDGNNTYVIKSDLNDLIPKIGDVNCINGDKVLGYVEGFLC